MNEWKGAVRCATPTPVGDQAEAVCAPENVGGSGAHGEPHFDLQQMYFLGLNICVCRCDACRGDEFGCICRRCDCDEARSEEE